MAELRQGFDHVADLYDRIRPKYPEELFAELFSRLPDRADVVEVGPGTGQATGSLLARAAHVTAVELGANLAERLRRNFEHDDRLHVIVSSFEEAVLPGRSFDALVSATAFHWIDEAVRLEKPFELLRPGGWVAVIDTVQVAARSDAGFFARAQPLYDRHAPPAHDPVAVAPEQAASRFPVEFAASSLYESPLLFRYRWDQPYATSAYADLMRSYSVTQAMPEQDREALIAEISALIDQEFGGHVTRPLVITLLLARAVR